MQPLTTSSEPARFISCTVALTATFACYWLLNYCAFPLFDPIYHWTREASAVVGGLALSALALVSFWSPASFNATRMIAATISCMIAGAGGMAAGIGWSSPVVLACGASLVTVGIGLANIIASIGCLSLDARRVGISVTLAYVAAYALRGAFEFAPALVNLTLFCLGPLITIALTARFARPVLDQAYAEGSPAQIALASPSSALPFGHQLFVTLLVFRFIYGFTLAFGEEGRIPLLALDALLPLALLLLFVLVKRTAINLDTLFQLSILCATAGFLLLAASGSHNALASTLLSCSTGFFEVLMCSALISLGTRNAAAALPVLAWGNAMASWGTLLGANVGRFLTVNAQVASAGAAATVFGIVAYVVLVQKTFSFASTIQGLVAASPVAAAQTAEEPLQSLEQRCRDIGSERNLTEREQEIFEYLARGRNVRFIQDELTVSYNTVKTHVSHIYAKLDVHSHQELIDLVERHQ